MTSSRKWLLNTAVVITSTVVSLGAVELALRVTDAAPPSIYEADSTLIYRLVPGSRKTFVHNATNGGAKIQVEINEDGFRGPRLRPAGSAQRIVVYGDSFIEGEFAPDSLTFPRLLERRLAQRGPTEVVNAGVLGWGPDQEYLRMRQELPTLKPRAVILAIFADNDLGDVVRDRLFRLGPDSSLEARHVTLHPTLRDVLSAQAHPIGWRRLAMVRWIERKRRRATESLPATRSRAGEPPFSMAKYAEWAMFNATRQYEDMLQHPDTVLDLLGDSYDVDVSATPDAPSARYKVAIMDRLLGEIQSDVSKRGMPLVVLIIPSPIDACDSYDVKIDPAKYPQYDRRRISRTVDSLAARHGMRRIDLWGPFREAGACPLYYRGGDLHWKPAGESIAAGLVADSLSAWGLVPDRW